MTQQNSSTSKVTSQMTHFMRQGGNDHIKTVDHNNWQGVGYTILPPKELYKSERQSLMKREKSLNLYKWIVAEFGNVTLPPTSEKRKSLPNIHPLVINMK